VPASTLFLTLFLFFLALVPDVIQPADKGEAGVTLAVNPDGAIGERPVGEAGVAAELKGPGYLARDRDSLPDIRGLAFLIHGMSGHARIPLQH
jgi:hypothetical protein